jgi:spore coat polysaccharide biosynthesis protein SpsF
MKTTAIIQARMGSTRLPKKVLMPLEGIPVLKHIVDRLSSVKQINNVVIATSVLEINDEIAAFCKAEKIDSYRGSENDVLSRFYKTALKYPSENYIRVTGDCPLIDPLLVESLIDHFFDQNLDYSGIATGAGVANSGFVGRYPDGLDTEIFTFNTLQRAYNEAEGLQFREHVTPYIWKNPEKFKLGIFMSKEKDYSSYRWTLDNIEDYHLIKWIYSKLYPQNPNFNMYDVLDLLDSNKKFMNKNKHLIGKEGYEEFWK